MSGKMGLPGMGLARSTWNMALNTQTALMQSFSRVGTTQFTSTLTVVMIILLVSCTCVGVLSIACPSKFNFLGRSTNTPFLRSALSPFASALMPSPFLSQKESDPHKNLRPPPLCPALVMPVCKARFGVPMYELAQLGAEGEVNIVGLSGNPLLRALVRKIGNARTLEIAIPDQNSAPRATITPSMSELAGHSQQGCRALEIRGMRGSFYGVLEMRSSGACYVIREGQTVMMIDGDAESLQLSIKSSSGLQLASVRCSAEPFGGVDHVEIRVEPGVDTVLVLAVVLAVLLLSPYLPPPDQ